MKKLLLCITLCLMMIACGNTKKTKEIQKQEVTEILGDYNGYCVRSKTRLNDGNGWTCTLQLTKISDGSRQDCYVKDLPEWIWDEYELDDTIHIEVPVLSEPEEQSITEDSAGKKTIVIDGVVYELTEKSI